MGVCLNVPLSCGMCVHVCNGIVRYEGMCVCS